uniref:leucine-rich repeat extensin-like protein 4 n=1 Tax=Erigeron canadensis TaxID=72917 RepID=UPI001CB9CC53|nr:leucine-rich repeat extensin-like protein 4 [Erigeron canadensis]
MQTLGFFCYIGLFLIFYVSSFSVALTKVQVPVSRRRLTKTVSDLNPAHALDDIKVDVDPSLVFESPRLKKAYYAFQEWKKTFLSDPLNMTGNWVGPDVCGYYGVVCALALDDESIVTVAVIDLNFGDIAGRLVPELGLLTDLGILHLHANRFCGTIPETMANLKLLFELDLSSNHLAGTFPRTLLTLSSLRFLDIRFNEFEGPLPPEIFDMEIDALILNNNRFYHHIPKNIGNSQASVLVLSNNKFSGCIPKGVGRMARLEQVSFSNNRLTGCLPEEIGMLKFLIVLDVSKNHFVGSIPKSYENLKMMERFDFSRNALTGQVSDSMCSFPRLFNMTVSSNYFNDIGAECEKFLHTKRLFLYENNCIPNKPNQRPDKNCSAVLNHPIDCKTVGCQPRDPIIIEHMKKRKAPPQPNDRSPLPPVMSTLTPPADKQPRIAAPPPPTLNDPNLPPMMASRYLSPPPVIQD